LNSRAPAREAKRKSWAEARNLEMAGRSRERAAAFGSGQAAERRKFSIWQQTKGFLSVAVAEREFCALTEVNTMRR
jgi:uncharacterized cupin superfamily protein